MFLFCFFSFLPAQTKSCESSAFSCELILIYEFNYMAKGWYFRVPIGVIRGDVMRSPLGLSNELIFKKFPNKSQFQLKPTSKMPRRDRGVSASLLPPPHSYSTRAHTHTHTHKHVFCFYVISLCPPLQTLILIHL